MATEPAPKDTRQLEATGAAVGLGCSIVVTLIGLIAGGAALDRLFGTGPTLTLIGTALALVAAGYELYELARIGRSDRPPGPLGKRLAAITANRSANRAEPPVASRVEQTRMDGEE
ncbi:MAG: AtpZ/AtpI family protein [Chloroflexia bacterium]|nr:AtpZ/AtpI family protein [Chloroflexia bacterium]MDQ3410826.1 AtpZ/AtpI family protein [Chloroflexota bacterium]